MFWDLPLDDFSGAFCGQGKYPLMALLQKNSEATTLHSNQPLSQLTTLNLQNITQQKDQGQRRNITKANVMPSVSGRMILRWTHGARSIVHMEIALPLSANVMIRLCEKVLEEMLIEKLTSCRFCRCCKLI